MRVLAIDGGGIRGLIPALVLAEIERRTERRTADLVDLVAGTSTGAIVACALLRPDPLPAQQVADLYVQEGPKIFDRTLRKIVTSAGGYIDEKYDDDGLVAALRKWLGTARLADALKPVLLTAYDLQGRNAVLLRSSDGSGASSDGPSLSMVDAAHASSAAPTYFEPVRVGGMTLVDGGVFAVNPAMIAFAETAGQSLDVLASLGTGEHTRPLPYREVVGWGKLEWAAPIIDVVFDGSADAVDEQLSRLAGDLYIRLQTRLDEASDDLDDASPQNLAALQREAQRLIDARSADIERLCALLTA